MVLVGILVGFAGAKISTDKISTDRIHYEAPTPKVVKVEMLKNGRTNYVLNNGLEALVSEAEGIYQLYLPFMGDHTYDYNSKEMLINGIGQYSENIGWFITETVNTMLEEYDRDQQ